MDEKKVNASRGRVNRNLIPDKIKSQNISHVSLTPKSTLGIINR